MSESTRHPGGLLAGFPVNYPAVGVSVLATILVGALWYSPLLFGSLWTEAHGYSQEQARAMAGRAFVVSLFCYSVMAFVLAMLLSYTGASTALQGAFVGFLVWIGFLAPLGLTSHMFSEKPLAIYLIDAGYQLVYAVVMGVILAAWRRVRKARDQDRWGLDEATAAN